MPRKPSRVREPVQAYLDRADADILLDLSERTGQPKAEVIRQAIRRMAQDLDLASRPGAGIHALLGSLDSAAELPADLAARHDEYLYASDDDVAPSGR